MPNLKCDGTDCSYETGEQDANIAIALLNNHTSTNHVAPTVPRVVRRAPRVERPTLSDNISEEHWLGFRKSWDMFTQANAVSNEDQPVHLYACCDVDLRAKVTCTNENIFSKSVEEILDMLHSLAVYPVAVSVQRTELLKLQQAPGESIRTFFSRVRGKALSCKFQLQCTEPHTVDDQPVYVNYTNEIIRHVIVAGLYDDEIRRDIFGLNNLENMLVADLVTIVEGKEIAREATRDQSVAAISQFKREKSNAVKTNYEKKGKCCRCNKTFDLYRKMRNGRYNKKHFQSPRNVGRKHVHKLLQSMLMKTQLLLR